MGGLPPPFLKNDFGFRNADCGIDSKEWLVHSFYLLIVAPNSELLTPNSE